MHTPQLDRVRLYLRALHESDTPGLIDAFEPDGTVVSPFLGRMAARDFFPRLAAASERSVIRPIDLFVSAGAADAVVRIAAYFDYDWTLSDGQVVPFRPVDIFEFAPGSDRIRTMVIVYDTHPIRQDVGDKYGPPAAP